MSRLAEYDLANLRLRLRWGGRDSSIRRLTYGEVDEILDEVEACWKEIAEQRDELWKLEEGIANNDEGDCETEGAETERCDTAHVLCREAGDRAHCARPDPS